MYHLERFEADNGVIYLNDMSVKWVESFVLWQMDNECAKNSIALQVTQLKAVLNRLHATGVSKFNPSPIPVKFELVDHVFNTMEELQQLRNTVFTNPGLEKVRDIYILHCFLGVRFSDLQTILKNIKTHIRHHGNKKYISVTTQKTSQYVVVPIGNIVNDIIGKYNLNFGNLFSYQHYNEYIKLVADAAGINQEIVLTRTVGGRRKDSNVSKNLLMASHTARRTFATNCFLAGIPERNIMYITGHRTTESFHRYIKADALTSAISIANTSFFNLEMPETIGIENVKSIS